MAAALDTQLHYSHPHHLPPPQPLNCVTTCDRHPDQQVTGFCASCLRERLAGLDPATRRLRSTSVSSGASTALKSLFFRQAAHGHSHHNAVTAASSSLGSSILPQLRRCKSFSLGRGAPPAAAFEPQRRSCDVRGRSTLGSLFHLDDSGPSTISAFPFPPPVYCPAAAPDAGGGEIAAEPQSRGRVSGVAPPVLESREEEEEEDGEEDEHRYREVGAGLQIEELGEGDDESRGVRPPWADDVEEEEEEVQETGKQDKLRPMKDHIDFDAQSKKTTPKDFREIAGSFWVAASVFSKKLQKWRRKQKEKKHRHAAIGASRTPVVAPATGRPSSRSRRFSRDTQSEVAEYAFGRRSCDTEPRFSFDAGRVSFDDPRFSWDEPRASWDGYLFGGGRSSALPRLPPMLSVHEDAPVVQRSDGQIPVEEDAAATAGGSSQTKDYYLDSSSQRRRRSLDRSSSRRSSVEAATAAELLKPVSDARLSPDSKLSPIAMANEYLQHVSKFERDYNSSSWNALHDDCWESVERGGEGRTPRKPRVWSKAWSLWGLIHRRRSRGGEARVVERSLSETWQVLPGEGHTRKFFRSNSSVGCRHSFYGSSNAGVPGSARRSGLEISGHGKKRREEFVLERCRSSRRYSPSRGEGGSPRFYVTPVPSNAGLPKGRCRSSHSLPRSVLRLY